MGPYEIIMVQGTCGAGVIICTNSFGRVKETFFNPFSLMHLYQVGIEAGEPGDQQYWRVESTTTVPHYEVRPLTESREI